jgi:hypothetical protein
VDHGAAVGYADVVEDAYLPVSVVELDLDEARGEGADLAAEQRQVSLATPTSPVPASAVADELASSG